MRREPLMFVMFALVAMAPIILITLHMSVLHEPASWDANDYLMAESEDKEESSESEDQTIGATTSSVMSGAFNAITNNTSTVAYAISLTGCDDKEGQIGSGFHVQGAAVLGQSIRRNSAENPKSGSKYGYKLFAFVHLDAAWCSKPYADVGYEILIRDTPVNVTKIRGDFLRENVHKIGCCGEKEYLKLYSLELTNYPIVVHFDMDCLLLRPLDQLFDVMLDGPASHAAKNLPVMFNKPIPDRVDAFFTRDYNMVRPGKKYPGFQGGFLVFRPNHKVFQEYVNIIYEGNFKGGAGWNSTFGGYWGAMQIQGLCSYYYDGLHPGTAVELNRCVYNQMVDAPRKKEGKSEEEVCIDGTESCEDCREANIDQIYSAHFTQECGKPWDCRSRHKPLCRDLIEKWFLVRREFDYVSGGKLVKPFPPDAYSTFRNETFHGLCKGAGPKSYIPFQLVNND